MIRKLALLLLIVLLLGCSSKENSNSTNKLNTDLTKPMAWGKQQKIYIFADDNIWKYAEDPLRTNLERVLFTTENETYFEIERIAFSKLEQFYKFNNLIFFCDISSSKEVSTYVKSIMGETVTEEVAANTVGIYPQTNLWANDQFTLFLLGDNEEDLLKLNILQADRVFELFKDKLYDRIADRTFKYKNYHSREFADLSWEITLPQTYVIYRENKVENFVSYLARGREKPDRYLAVYSEKITEENFNRDWLKEKRAALVWKYYDEDEFKDRDVRIENYDIAGYKGWKLSGRWQNMKYLVGGAFQSFAFYDQKSGCAYIVDNSVYWPEGYKLTTLAELEAISNTIIIK